MAAITLSEKAQLEQTVEMFRVITQSQPMDHQSLEILKEAYTKLGQQREVLETSKRIAAAYVQLGQLSSAILEYETILQHCPDDPDVQKALGEIEAKTSSFAVGGAAAEVPVAGALGEETHSGRGLASRLAPQDLDDGKAAMQKILVGAKLMSAQDFARLWLAPTLEPPTQVVEPFLQVLADKGLVGLEAALKVLVEKARVGYVPLDRYDVDMELAKSFPRSVCLKWCVLPFDRMSKTVMIATANPFNKQAAAELQQATPNRLLWFVASPPDLVKGIKKVFR